MMGVRIEVGSLEVGQVVRAAFAETIDSQTGDVVFDRPITGDVEIARDLHTVRLRGALQTSMPLSCGRCLVVFRQPLRAHLKEEFLVDPVPPSANPGQRALGREDFLLPLGADLMLDVSEAVRQHLLLALPMVPLCRPDCRGLCPQCGTNWNEKDCEHQVMDVDPRLAPLLELKDRLPEK